MSYRWIISPNIIEIHTETLPIKGLAICNYNKEYNNFLLNSYSNYKNCKYYCKIGEIKIPEESEARYNYYLLKNNVIYYKRKVGPLSFRFSYNLKTRTIVANYLCLNIPFELGQLWPIGLHLSNIIAVDLLLEKNLLFIGGAAIQYNDETICIFSPSRTGKTKTVEALLRYGAKYISEDIILTDGKKVYLVPPNDKRFFKKNIRYLIKSSVKETNIDKILFVIGHISEDNMKNEEELAISLLRIYSNRIPYEIDRFIHALFYFKNFNFISLERKCVKVLKKLIRNSEINIIKNLNEYFK